MCKSKVGGGVEGGGHSVVNILTNGSFAVQPIWIVVKQEYAFTITESSKSWGKPKVYVCS